MPAALVSSVSSEELAQFCREFAVMLASDVKLMPAVVTLRQQTENPYFREVLLEEPLRPAQFLFPADSMDMAVVAQCGQ